MDLSVLYFLGQWFADFAGPLRLLSSNIFLTGAGTAAAAMGGEGDKLMDFPKFSG